MREQRFWMSVAVCLLGVLVSTLGAGAQEGGQPQERERQPPPGDVIIEREIVEEHGPGQMALAPEIVMGQPAGEFGLAFISSEMSFDGRVVRGAPYSAEAITEMVQTLGDGNRIVRKSTATLYRDGEGRTRRDQTFSAIGPFATLGDSPQNVLINDPVAGVNYILEPRGRTARKLKLPPRDGAYPAMAAAAPGAGGPPALMTGPSYARMALPGGVVKKVEPVYPPAAKAAGAQGLVKVTFVTNEAGEVESAEVVEGHPLLQQAAVDAIKQWRFRPAPSGSRVKVKGEMVFNFQLPGKGEAGAPSHEWVTAPDAEWVNESLGTQVIEGVEAEGTRATLTIPAGAIGNERPLKVLTERWFSPELQTVVLTKQSDPRFGETTYRLTNINRSEPARSLFEVPSDYTVKEDRFMRFQMKRQPKD